MVLTGDIGSGKTTLCRTVLETIDSNVYAALLLNPFLSETDLMRAILKDFGIHHASRDKHQLMDRLNEFLLCDLEEGARAIVLIDEAQNIPLQTLEQIRILASLETSREKLLQIVLVGQLSLLDILATPELRQLRQRISIKCQLAPLTRQESGDYLRHRLAVAGAPSPNTLFSPDGTREVYACSRGVPRLINLIADRALLAGMALDSRSIGKFAVREAVHALQLPKTASERAGLAAGTAAWGRHAAVVVGLSVVFALIFVLLMNGLPAR
jgi:general secretion pathway protein A